MESVDPLELARRLIGTRKALGLTQTKLAEKARKSPATISGLESGKIARPHLGTILDLAEALDLTPAELTGVLASPKDPPPRSMDELLDQAGAKTRHHALPQDGFEELWLNRDAAQREVLKREFLEERELIRPLVANWREMPRSEERSQLYKLWLETFIRLTAAIAKNQEAAQAEAEAARQEGDEVRARRLVEEAEEFGRVA